MYSLWQINTQILITQDFNNPMKIKLATNNNNDIAAGVKPVNNFFSHWIKETDIKRYGNNIPILPLTNTVEIYKCSDEMLKHMPKDS